MSRRAYYERIWNYAVKVGVMTKESDRVFEIRFDSHI